MAMLRAHFDFAPGAEGEPQLEQGALMRSDRTRSQAAASQWQTLRKELSVGLELECFLPDLGALAPNFLTPVETREGLFGLVAERLTARLRRAHASASRTVASPAGAKGAGGGAQEAATGATGSHSAASLPRCRANWRRVSADKRDWGSLWTVTEDGSIKPELGGSNPFPVELVSKLMRFNDVDVTLFCDMVHTLSSPPISGKANDSTGLHVHIGKHPGFFTVWEVVRILKAYIRYEPVINRLLPLSRRKNVFCEDLRSVLAKLGGFGEEATEEELMRHVDAAMEKVKSMSREELHAVSNGVQGATTRGRLLPGLLKEGLVWSCCDQRMMLRSSPRGNGGSSTGLGAASAGTAVAAAVEDRWVAPGMVLRELWRETPLGREVLWKAPSSSELVALFAADEDGPPGPDGALNELDDDEDEVFVDFAPPPEVCAAGGFELWLLRGALGFVGRQKDRYCKLNLMRMHLPSHKATLEFRQFPGGNFDQALTIWGWVQFLGLFISQSIASPVPLPCPSGPPADEQELLTFMQLSSDTLLLAWYRDTLMQQPSPQAVISSTRARWRERCSEWRAAASAALTSSPSAPSVSSLAPASGAPAPPAPAAAAGGPRLPSWGPGGGADRNGAALLEACARWRSMFWAMAGAQSTLGADDEVWAEFQADKPLRVRFLQRLLLALDVRLSGYTEHLRAMEEVSRLTSLTTVVTVAVGMGGVQRAREEIRTLQASITETGGWRQCEPPLLRSIGEHGSRAVELLLDHIRNLLELCERTAATLASEGARTSSPSRQPGAAAGGGGEAAPPFAPALTQGFEADASSSFAGTGSGAAVGGGMLAKSGARGAADVPREAVAALLRRLYAELCVLLAPRADEVQDLWRGLRERGWGAGRVEALNLGLSAQGLVDFGVEGAPDAALGLD